MSSRVPTARRIFFEPPDADERVQDALEREFFSALRLANGTYKFTYSNRLDDLNDLLLPLLPTARPLEVLDVAVSSGISTLEWVRQLERAGVAHRMTAGDLTAEAFLISRGRHLHALADANGYALQYEVFGRALPSPPRRIDRYLNAALWLMRRTLAARFASLRAASCEAAKDEVVGDGGVMCRRVALVSAQLRARRDLEVVEDDILSGVWRGRRSHVVRAANILNRSYFDEPSLRRALSNLRARLLPGGLLVVCRTDDETATNHATVFSLRDDGTLTVVSRLGGGSEVEELALALDQPLKSSEADTGGA